jgi:ankyrin repeat protein
MARNIITCAINNNLNIINQSTTEGNTALITCIRELRKLDSENYTYETGNKYTETEAMSLYFDCLDTIKYLLECGADPEVANVYGLTPLEGAQYSGNQEIIDLIQDAINQKHKKESL